MKLRTYLLLTIVLPLIAACGDDVTNHNYPAPPPAEEEEQPQKPPFEEGKWITDAHSMCYFNILPENRYTLYPVWLLQANGVKRAYEDSEFAQEFISDDIFRNHQGYCMEFAIAFASWCLNQGVVATIEFVPGHAVNRIFDNEENAYPVDMTCVASNPQVYTPFANPPTKEDFEQADRMFENVMTISKKNDTDKYEPGRIENPGEYDTVDVIALRHFLPSFNIGDSYAHTRAAWEEEEGLNFKKRRF